MKFSAKYLAAVAALSCAASASAGVYEFQMPLVPPGDPYSDNDRDVVGDVFDTFKFTAPSGASMVFGSVVSLEIRDILIELLDVSGTVVASGTPGPGVPPPYVSQIKGVRVIPDATYSFKVTGSAGTGSSYAFMAAAIPEPQTYALVLGGLGLSGVIGARRRRQR